MYCAAHQCRPSKIWHWANVCFSEQEYFEAETTPCFRDFPMFIHFVQAYCWILMSSWLINDFLCSKVWILQERENDILLRKWTGGTAQLHMTLEGPLRLTQKCKLDFALGSCRSVAKTLLWCRFSPIMRLSSLGIKPRFCFFFRWNISVICLTVLLKLAMKVYFSPCFQTFWSKWLNFFRSFQKRFGVWPQNKPRPVNAESLLLLIQRSV